MSDALLLTKVYGPPPRHNLVFRPRLVERLNEGLSSGRKLTLISAPAGFGKTTLVSEWVAGPRDCPPKLVCGNSVAWLSLDEADNDPARFISYLVAALQTILPGIGESLLPALQSPQPLHIETLLTALLNEISKMPEHFVLILEDYHSIDSRPVDHALDFLVEHQPPQMHLVITTREDPQLPLARYRARGQLTELRAADLRFTPGEAAELLNQVTGLGLSVENIAALETRTEGWVAGLQLAAISMQGHKDAASFIQSFTGSHHFVMDYLIEEVLQQQSESIQAFLLHTSILDRMCGPLCDAILPDFSVSGQATLEYLEHANLFTIPLDNERGWYRYHHLFGDLLRKRLGQTLTPQGIAGLHLHASGWYENHDLMLDAFRHAALANDLERAIRLMESRKMPLHRRGTATTILDWLDTLPETVRNARPVLWWKQASLMLEIGQTIGVEEKLQAAEACNGTSRDLTEKSPWPGRFWPATSSRQKPSCSRRAGLWSTWIPSPAPFIANLMLGYAYFLHSDLTEAGQAYTEALTLAQAGADIPNTTLAKYRLGQLQAESNQIHQAAETFQQILELISEYSPSNAAIAYMSLADINYEWNNLDVAEKYLEQSSQLAQQYAHVVDRMVLNILYLARLKLAQGDVSAAESLTSQAEQTAQQKNICIRLPDLAYCRAEILLRQGRFAEVTQLAQQNDLPLMHARALIALGEPTAALEVIEPLRQKAEAKLLVQRRLEVMTVQSVALFVQGEKEQAIHLLGEVLALAEPGGFVRLFLNEGTLMAELLSAAAAQGIRPDYVKKLLATFAAETKGRLPVKSITGSAFLVEPLSLRELEILRLIAQGLSNQEICKLFLALDTVKGHNRRIFEKLQVHRRTEAIARARELNLF